MDWIVPTFHPSFIARNNRRFEGKVVKVDLARALALARGEWNPQWDRSKYIIKPSFSVAMRTLTRMAKSRKRLSYDIETDGRHPLVCSVRCLAFYDGKQAICIPFLYRDGSKVETWVEQKNDKSKLVTRSKWVPYWTPDQWEKVKGVSQDIFTQCPLDTQNGQYDRLCLEARNGFEIPSANAPGNFDCILGHHIVASYFPHALNFLACTYTEAPYYKTTEEGEAWSSSTDMELWVYNCDDVQAQYTAATTLRQEIRERKEDLRIYEHDSWYEEQGQRWKKVGVEVDWRAVELFRVEYGVKQDKALAAMRRVLQESLTKDAAADEYLQELLAKLEEKAEKGVDAQAADTFEGLDEFGREVTFFNPASLAQLRLLLRHLGVPLTQQTATGDLSTAKDFLLEARKELKEQGLRENAPALAFLDYLFAWREAAKLKSTYLYPVILPDGRCHPSFSYHIVPSGRLTSSAPNYQNQPGEIRGIFIARKGHRLVTGDWDAGEMRITAFASGDDGLIETLAAYDAGTGMKPHIVNASTLFGLECNKELPDKFPGCYRAAKVFIYLLTYGGGPQTCYDKMRDEMPDLSWDAFLDCFNRYKKAHPKLFEYQRDVVLRGTQQRHLDSPILNRRVYFWEQVLGEDSPEASVMQNFGAQSGLAEMVSLANRRLETRCVKPWRAERLRQNETIEQLAQVHDELLYEVPIRLSKPFKEQFKTICEEPADESVRTWRMPVDVKVREPLNDDGAPSRWKDIHVSSSCCGKLATVEYVQSGCKDDVTIWTGVCENKKCKKHGKKFELSIPHSQPEITQ